MALFVSVAPELRAVVKVGGKTHVVRFSRGSLDTAQVAPNLGVATEELDAAIRALPSFGRRVFESKTDVGTTTRKKAGGGAD